LQVSTDLEQDLIQFSVMDNGIGIAPERLQNFFQPFVQVDISLNRQYEGNGLGLTLVQKLTGLHGGSIDVESEVGKGGRFTINLACQQNETAINRLILSLPGGNMTNLVRYITNIILYQ
jgi:signal transduction histidine kinase